MSDYIKCVCIDCGKEFYVSIRHIKKNPDTAGKRCSECSNVHRAATRKRTEIKKVSAAKKRGRKCRGCGKYMTHNYFYCDSCNAKQSQPDEICAGGVVA